MRASAKFDLIDTVEAAYRVERPTVEWLTGILASLQPLLDDGVGLYGHTYEVDGSLRLVGATFASLGCSEGVQAALPVVLEQGQDFVHAAYLQSDVGCASAMPGWRGSVQSDLARSMGVLDSWGINGRNLDRRGVVVIANRRRVEPLPERTAGLFTRIAAHLAAAARLRRRLGDIGGEAVLEAVMTPDGHVEHAIGEAKTRTSMAALAEATRARESSRRRISRRDSDHALDAWKGRVAARWTLVDSFEKDGRRFVLARENELRVPSRGDLSPRERQVLASAALGRTNKEIAYDLGIAHATVRVLIARAAQKLRARSRDELLSRFAETLEEPVT